MLTQEDYFIKEKEKNQDTSLPNRKKKKRPVQCHARIQQEGRQADIDTCKNKKCFSILT